MEMKDYKDKIRKLLALAESPSEHEAKAAILKARQLMVEHKIRLEDIESPRSKGLIRKEIGVACTKRKGAWKIDLSAIIAEAYCCKAFNTRKYRSRTYHIGLIGLEDDFEVCERILKYAVDCVEQKAEEIHKKYRDIYTPQYIDKLIDAYAVGFNCGVSIACKRQEENHQEWGLILITPKEVQEEWEALEDAGTFKEFDLAGPDKMQYAIEGKQDGQNFKPERRIKE